MSRTHPKAMFATADETEQAFYDALNRADLDGLASLWAEDEEIICIHPGGPRLEGLNAIRDSWQEIFRNGPLQIRLNRAAILSGMMISVHTVIEEIILTDQDGGTQIAYVNATNVYHKTPRGWRLVLHHASPATETPSLPPVSALH